MSGTEGNVATRAGNSMAGLAGSAQKMAGQAIGNEQMQAEGEKARKEAEAKNAASSAKQEGEGQKDNMMGNLKEGAGNLMGNEQMQAEGKGDQAKGEANKKASDIL